MFTLFLFCIATLLVFDCDAQQNDKCNSINIKSNFVYGDLKCVPKYDESTSCLKEYDCSHIHSKPSGKCLLRGKLYKPGENPDVNSGAEGRCDHASCTCSESGDFDCLVPSDSCAEWWVPGFVQPGCYLKYELGRCCSTGQICQPYDDNTKCKVNGVTYDEGNSFDHPNEKCTQCVCQKGFDGKLVAPFCQRRNCTTELLYSKQIRDYCAPLYRNTENCCPSSWICPKDDEKYIPAPSEPPKDPQCQFGNRKMRLGEKIEQQIRVRETTTCECITPPYLTCTSKVN